MEIKEEDSIEKIAMSLCAVHSAWPEERWNNDEPCKFCDKAEEAFHILEQRVKEECVQKLCMMRKERSDGSMWTPNRSKEPEFIFNNGYNNGLADGVAAILSNK